MLARVQRFLNTTALFGWDVLLAASIARLARDELFPPVILQATLFLQLICLIEVALIANGMVKGNLWLGIGLHYTRSVIVLLVLPGSMHTLSAALILLAWSATEACRCEHPRCPERHGLRPHTHAHILTPARA